MSIEPTLPTEAATGPSELDQLIAATGKSYYRKPFEKFARDRRISASWNWAASFFGMYWLFHRGMPAYAIAYLAAGQIAFAVLPPWLFAYISLGIGFAPDSVSDLDLAYRLAFCFGSVVVFPCDANALIICMNPAKATSSTSWTFKAGLPFSGGFSRCYGRGL